PGEVREVRFAAGVAGTYYYWATVSAIDMNTRAGIDAELSGAFIVDPLGMSGPARDRVFVLSLWGRGPLPGGVVVRNAVLRFTINGKTWPNTERLTYTVGDSVRFRII